MGACDPSTPVRRNLHVTSEAQQQLAARMGRWSARHKKTAIFGWLAFVVAAFMLGNAIGTKQLDKNDTLPGESGHATQFLDESSSRPQGDRPRPEHDARPPTTRRSAPPSRDVVRSRRRQSQVKKRRSRSQPATRARSRRTATRRSSRSSSGRPDTADDARPVRRPSSPSAAGAPRAADRGVRRQRRASSSTRRSSTTSRRPACSRCRSRS